MNPGQQERANDAPQELQAGHTGPETRSLGSQDRAAAGSRRTSRIRGSGMAREPPRARLHAQGARIAPQEAMTRIKLWIGETWAEHDARMEIDTSCPG